MVHTHGGHYSGLDRKDILTPATWMDLEATVKPATHKKTSTGGFHLCEVPRVIRSTRQTVGWWAPGLGGGRGDQCFMGTVLQSPKTSEFWRQTV